MTGDHRDEQAAGQEATQPLVTHWLCPYCAQPVVAGAPLCRWCGHQLGTPVNMPASGAARRFAPGIGLVVGGILVAVSPLLPWLQVVLLGDLNLFDIAHAAPPGALPLVLLPVALVVCGAAAITAGLVLRHGVAARVVAGILLTASGAVGGLLLAGLLNALSGTWGLVRVGAGPWLDVAGALIMLIGALVPAPRVAVSSPGTTATGRTVFAAAASSITVLLVALGVAALADTNVQTPEAAAAPSPPSAAPTLPAEPSQPATTEPNAATALPQAPTTTSPDPGAGLASAEALVESKGYRPYANTTWDSSEGLQVVLATVADSGDGAANRAFFFYNDQYLGTDTSSDSAGIQELWSTGDTIALSYELYNTDDPMCCPTASAATVRYHWTGAGLTPLDSVPSADSNANPSRR